MADQDSPWQGLPPAPPGVPDQAPRPPTGPTPAPPDQDPWARPAGWQPPSSRRSRRSGGPSGGGASTLAKLALGFGAFLLLSTCIRVLPTALPGLDDAEPAIPVPIGTPGTFPPATTPTYRVVRGEHAPDGAEGWFTYAPERGGFVMVGPGRPRQDVSRRAGTYTFGPEAGVTFVAEVSSIGGAGGNPRAFLDRQTAIILDDLGAVEQERRWTRDGPTLVLETDARRGDARVRVRTWVERHLLFRATASWGGAPTAEDGIAIERFLDGLGADGP